MITLQKTFLHNSRTDRRYQWHGSLSQEIMGTEPRETQGPLTKVLFQGTWTCC